MRKKLIIANWKMNGSLKSTEQWISHVIQSTPTQNVDLVLCPPFNYLLRTHELTKGSALHLGAQDVSNQLQGAYTGQISALMLKEAGCGYVIVGHSERRHFNHEGDYLIAEKFMAAQAENLIPVLCVGETLEQHQEGKTEKVVSTQIQAVIKKAGISSFSQAVIAYEPVWAIGTDLAATPAQAQAVHEMIRAQLSEEDIDVANQIRLLYGGSVKPTNAAGLFSQPDIDGALIGGASLNATDFLAIANQAD